MEEDEKINTEDNEKTNAPLNEFPDFTSTFITDEVFETRDALLNWCQDIAFNHGFDLVIIRSNQDITGKSSRVTIGCEMNGKCRPSHKNKKIVKKSRVVTASRKYGCPFTLKGRVLRSDAGEGWKAWVNHGFHNHVCAKHLECHPFSGQLTVDQKSLVEELTENNVKSNSISLTLKDHYPRNFRSKKQNYNPRHDYRLRVRFPRTEMQQFMHLLEESNYIHLHRKNESTNVVEDLFWTHPRWLVLLHSFSIVLVMDITYKTNKYRMPLLQIVGQTSTMKTYSVAFAFLQSEKVENYLWVLQCLRSLFQYDDELPQVIVTNKDASLGNAVRNIFPKSSHLLCQFHVNMNLKSNCLTHISDKKIREDVLARWDDIVHCQSIDDYETCVKVFKEACKNQLDFLKYVEDNWLNENKVKFVEAWTNNVMHLGNTTTYRVEGAHARLKKFLCDSLGDPPKCFVNMDKLLRLQHKDIEDSFEISKTTMDLRTNIDFYKFLRSFVSRDALGIIYTEVQRAIKARIGVICYCHIRSTHGLPCACELRKYHKYGLSTPLSVVHLCWQRLSFQVEVVKFELPKRIDVRLAFEQILRRLDELDKTEAMILASKVNELVWPQTTTRCPPPEKIQSKGAKKKVKSTEREPSEWEHAESLYDSPSIHPKQVPKETKKSRNPSSQCSFKQVLTRTRQPAYKDAFPPELHCYIDYIVDVESDGNCGFRSLALSLGLDESKWSKIRQDMIKELIQRETFYRTMYQALSWQYLSNDLYGKLTNALHVDSWTEFAHHENWLELPLMGTFIATTFQVILVSLGDAIWKCHTYLPLKGSPCDGVHQVWAIGEVRKNHWGQVKLVPDPPLPPLYRDWQTFRDPEAAGWETLHFDQFARFLTILPPPREAEHVNLDSD